MGEARRDALRVGFDRAIKREPVLDRYRDTDVPKFFRGDAAFAIPELYDVLEAEGYEYVIRLKSPMSIRPHPCPTGPTGPPGRRLGAGLGLSPSIPLRRKRLQLGFPRGACYTHTRKAGRWSEARVRWGVSDDRYEEHRIHRKGAGVGVRIVRFLGRRRGHPRND